MATKRNVTSNAPAAEDISISNKAVIDEAIERNWEIPNFTIKEIRDAIPAHCFRRDTFRSFTHVLHDIIIMPILAIGASYIDSIPNTYARIALWPLYWIAQGIVGTGVWVIGHECGHQAFSPSKTINNSVGYVLHTALLVPYHSWRFSHSKHHKATGHMSKDQVFVPSTRKEYGLPPREQDPEVDGPHDALDEVPLLSCIACSFNLPLAGLFISSPMSLVKITPVGLLISTPSVLSTIENQFWDVMSSTAGVLGMIGFLAYCGQVLALLLSSSTMLFPYLNVNFWLVLITYLQHTDPKLPHYRENVWNFQRGAALTVDRSYGFLLDYFHHHISDTHVAHHFFSTMPHYHAEEATVHIKKALGKHYHCDNTPVPIALWKVWKSCRFVEDEGDVVFFKN
uniref:Delta-12 desaturase n=1 Tax=Amylomyces rouxii TaxID=29923 RepID=Q9UVR3_AMYRO|nr:delta-12 desaturase [Amylomyces rouxii]